MGANQPLQSLLIGNLQLQHLKSLLHLLLLMQQRVNERLLRQQTVL
jgi:hypothetical protein